MSDNPKDVVTRILTTITDDGHTKTVAIEEVDGPTKQTLFFMVDDSGSDLWDGRRIERKIGTVALGEHFRQWRAPAASQARAEIVVESGRERERELDEALGFPPQPIDHATGGDVDAAPFLFRTGDGPGDWSLAVEETAEERARGATLGAERARAEAHEELRRAVEDGEDDDPMPGEYRPHYLRRWVGTLTDNDAKVCLKIADAVQLVGPIERAEHRANAVERAHMWRMVRDAVHQRVHEGRPPVPNDLVAFVLGDLRYVPLHFRPWTHLFIVRLLTQPEASAE
jgi:hypothetical protein